MTAGETSGRREQAWVWEVEPTHSSRLAQAFKTNSRGSALFVGLANL